MELHDDVQVAVLTATLRHELEHVRQRQICGSVLFDVDQYADDATIYKAGGLPGSRVFYNLKPTEQDANAAAAMLLAEDFSDGVRATILDSKDAALARSLIPPGDPHTLLARTVCFIYLFDDIVEAESRSQNEIGFQARLDAVSKEAGDLWGYLVQQRQPRR